MHFFNMTSLSFKQKMNRHSIKGILNLQLKLHVCLSCRNIVLKVPCSTTTLLNNQIELFPHSHIKIPSCKPEDLCSILCKCKEQLGDRRSSDCLNQCSIKPLKADCMKVQTLCTNVCFDCILTETRHSAQTPKEEYILFH